METEHSPRTYWRFNLTSSRAEETNSVKEALIGQMTAINSENSCLMVEHMNDIYQSDNDIQNKYIYWNMQPIYFECVRYANQ